MSAAERKKSVYGVSQINAYIRNMLAQDFLLRDVLVRGEVSNCTYHSSGHIYFTLKDEKAAIACVMFAGSRKGLSFRLQEGQQVVVSGSVEVFERDGKYQLYAKRIFSDGAGTLSEKFERLKRTLEERGMFDPCYKRPLPRFIRTLGVVTAPTGAAIRDIINIAGRRNPYVQIILYPALVQGEHAAESIVRGIHALEALPVDVIIAGRGGGTLEDLWAFNDEQLARAIAASEIPVVSAVGHERDHSISDFVADYAAATPTAAAESGGAPTTNSITTSAAVAAKDIQSIARKRRLVTPSVSFLTCRASRSAAKTSRAQQSKYTIFTAWDPASSLSMEIDVL